MRRVFSIAILLIASLLLVGCPPPHASRFFVFHGLAPTTGASLFRELSQQFAQSSWESRYTEREQALVVSGVQPRVRLTRLVARSSNFISIGRQVRCSSLSKSIRRAATFRPKVVRFYIRSARSFSLPQRQPHCERPEISVNSSSESEKMPGVVATNRPRLNFEVQHLLGLKEALIGCFVAMSFSWSVVEVFGD